MFQSILIYSDITIVKNGLLGISWAAGSGTMLPEGGDGSSQSGEDPQEVPEKTDLEACWRVIAQQAQMLKNQEVLIQSLVTGMQEMKDHMTRLTNKPSPDDSKLSVDEVVKLMDRRGAPPPEPFEIGRGRSFDSFIDQFETYCQSKYAPGTMDKWTGELNGFLKGELLQVYKVWGGGERPLSEMKKNLKDYCTSQEGNNQSNKLRRFSKAVPEPGEMLHIYAYRLERLYAAAHPGVDVEENVELQSKLLSSLPIKCQEEISKEIDMQKNTLLMDTVPWTRIVRILKTYGERTKIETRYEPPEAKKDPIWFTSTNVQQIPGPNTHINQKPRGRQPQRDQRQSRSRSLSQNYQNQAWNNNFNNQANYNKHQHPHRNFVRFPKPICDFCGLPGHEKKVCWRFQGCCVRCGSPDHFARECPKPRRRRGSMYHNNNYQNQNGSQHPMNEYYDTYARARSCDRDNYLKTTPLNPVAPIWDPTLNNNYQAAAVNVNPELNS